MFPPYLRIIGTELEKCCRLFLYEYFPEIGRIPEFCGNKRDRAEKTARFDQANFYVSGSESLCSGALK